MLFILSPCTLYTYLASVRHFMPIHANKHDHAFIFEAKQMSFEHSRAAATEPLRTRWQNKSELERTNTCDMDASEEESNQTENPNANE